MLSETLGSGELAGMGALHELLTVETLTNAFHNAFSLGIFICIAVAVLSFMTKKESGSS
jgi:hypothetical protein